MVQRIVRRKSASYTCIGTAASALGMLALISSCVMPLVARQAASANDDAAVTLRLDPPIPFDPAGDPALPGVAGSMAADDTNQLIDTALAAQLEAQAITPAIFSPGSFDAGPAAAPFALRGSSSTDMLRASLCLTSAIYYEAAQEPDDGQRAVAQVVLNRVRHPAYPNTVCGVVYQGTERNDTLCQFTFGCDGALARAPSSAGWARARRVAVAALSGAVFAPVGLATHYHTLAVSPLWNRGLSPTGVFGAHIFYRMPGGAGQPQSFRARYFGREPTPAPKPKLYVPPTTPLFAGGMPFPAPVVTGPPLPALQPQPGTAAIAPVRSVATDRRYVPGSLPESDILPAYRSSGDWIGR